MIKLYLSSYRVPASEELITLIAKKPEDTKLALVPNAQDYYAQRARDFKIQTVVDYFTGVGYGPEVVDLLDYTAAKDIKQKLGAYNAVWVMGGNTFCLRYEMRRSGFEKVIADLLKDGLVYAGESAGAAVAGTSLKGIELADEPEFAEAVVWEGLNLTPHFILPHADNPAFAAANAAARQIHGSGNTVVAIDDNQVLIVDGRASRLVTGRAAGL